MRHSAGELSFICETSEWFDWLARQKKRGRFVSVNDEQAVLIIAKAIYRADFMEPDYGHLNLAVRSALVKSHIIMQCCEYEQSQKSLEAGAWSSERHESASSSGKQL